MKTAVAVAVLLVLYALTCGVVAIIYEAVDWWRQKRCKL